VLNDLLKALVAQVECALFRGRGAVFIAGGLSSRCVATGKVQSEHRKKHERKIAVSLKCLGDG
jgi:hypothetical protein